MKIGFFTDSYLPTPDGVATSVEATARELQKLGHDIYIIAPNQPHNKDRKNIIRLVSIQIIKSPEVRWALEIPQPKLFKIANLEFDIIHGHSGGPISVLGWQLAHLHNLPFIETYHTSWEHYQHYFPVPFFFNIRMIKKLNGFFINICDAAIAPSLKAKKELLRDGVKRPIFIVPTGISPDKFVTKSKGFLHERLTIPKDKRIILTVGRLHKEKSIDFLIKAFALTHKSCPDTVLVIIGKGPLKAKLEELAASLHIAESVYFAGTLEPNDMSSAYVDATSFIFASTSETQGLVVYEAFAAGLPVVAVADGAFENVIENGKNGYTTTKDEIEFANKLSEILTSNDLRKSISKHAKNAAKQYSIEFTSRILEQVYKEVLYTRTLESTHNKSKKSQAMIRLFKVKKHIKSEFQNLQDLIDTIKPEILK